MMSEKVETMKGNMDSDYEFLVTEKDYYHIGATQVVHDSQKLKYEKVERVIKYNQVNYLRAEKYGGFTDFEVGDGASVVILHDPTKKSDKSSTEGTEGITRNELRIQFESILRKKAPKTDEDLKAAVRAQYEEIMDGKAGNKSTATMLSDIKKELETED